MAVEINDVSSIYTYLIQTNGKKSLPLRRYAHHTAPVSRRSCRRGVKWAPQMNVFTDDLLRSKAGLCAGRSLKRTQRWNNTCYEG